jgi:hypothetical protein
MNGVPRVSSNGNLSAPAVIVNNTTALEVSFEQDVIVHDAVIQSGNVNSRIVMFDANAPAGIYRDPALRPSINMTVAGIECHGRTSAGILDAQLRLQGVWRTQYLGTRGAEIVAPDRLFANGFE